jgi:hypothetical protein
LPPDAEAAFGLPTKIMRKPDVSLDFAVLKRRRML